ncbi:hypothetical protein [Pseudomonas sp. TR47]|uniref:hypothetical protein n=1 Tax=Pseudomonas sp. TR47 TaxID=3342639 RepID=UPI00377034E1
MAIPVISDLPPAPTRSDGPGDFTPKADAMIGALQPLVVQINIATQWMAGQLTEAQAQAAAAGASAGAAAESADTAAQQVQLAADQVGLANTARTGAEAARDDAQAAAIAAGAAAGLPPERVPFSVLQINGAGAVSWGYGTPDASAAVVGQALILGPGKVPAWGYAGDQIGDILYTSRNPGAGYLPCNGGIYAQSSYPVLFSQLGLIGGERADNFVAKSATPPFANMAYGDNGVVLGWSTTAGSIGNVYRSTDYGVTFSLAATAVAVNVPLLMLHIGGSNWIAPMNSSGQYQLSTDNGSTFTLKTISTGGYLFGNAATDKAGTVLMTANDVVYRSTNYGLTFERLNTSTRALCYAGGGRWVGSYPGNSGLVKTSDDAFSTAQNRSVNGAMIGEPFAIEADESSGVIVGIISAAATNNMLVSYDRGESFNIRGSGGAYQPTDLNFAGGNTWLIHHRQGNSAHDTRKSTDGAKTFVVGPTANTSVSPYNFVSEKTKGYVIANCRAAGAGSYSLSFPSFGYDTNTQFKLPTLLEQEGSNPYVRAL